MTAASFAGPVYANGYVRSYAAYLGMDPDAAVRRFKKSRGSARAELVFPSPAEGQVPGGAACGWFGVAGDGLWRMVLPHQ